MNHAYTFPDQISEFIQNSKLHEISIGCSDSHVIEIIKDTNIYFLKIMKSGLLKNEYEHLKWLNDKLPVPEIIMYITENGMDYLVTKKMDGEMLCSDYYVENPDIAIKVLGAAFNKIYSVDISDCPFDVSNDYKLSLVSKRVKEKKVTTEDLKESTRNRFGTVEKLLEFLENHRPKEELVFSHGDTSLPNVFGEKKEFKGFIDVGDSGIADKWFDLAICEKSIRRNYGEEYVKKFYNELKIKYNEEQISYYLYMMELYP